jgi:hypothetical protein
MLGSWSLITSTLLLFIIFYCAEWISWVAACFMLVSYLAYSSSLKMNTKCSSKTPLIFHQTTRHYIPKARTHSHQCKNLKSSTVEIIVLIFTIFSSYTPILKALKYSEVWGAQQSLYYWSPLTPTLQQKKITFILPTFMYNLAYRRYEILSNLWVIFILNMKFFMSKKKFKTF